MIGVSDGVAFLIGVAVGAAGQYFADKYTDQRRRQEQSHDEARRFREVARKVSKLIVEMAADATGPNAEHVRDLVLMPSKGAIYNSGGRNVFVYYEEDHPTLRGQFAILENSGYVVDVTPGNAPTFRPTEEFVQYLRGFRASDLIRN